MLEPALGWPATAALFVLYAALCLWLGVRLRWWVRIARYRHDPEAAWHLIDSRAFEPVRQAAVMIFSFHDEGWGRGNGFLIHRHGYVMTAAHCVLNCRQVVAITPTLEVFGAQVVALDQESDCAILRIEGGSGPFPYVRLGTSASLRVGEAYFLCGWAPEWYLWVAGLDGQDALVNVEPRVYPHTLAGLQSCGSRVNLEFYGHGRPGFSGSAVWDSRSRSVVGLLSYTPYKQGESDRSGAVTVETLNVLTRKAGLRPRGRTQQRPRPTASSAARALALLELWHSEGVTGPGAIEHLSSLIEHWPDLFVGYLLRGRAHLDRGEVAMAQQDARTARQLAPASAGALDLLGKVLCHQAMEALNQGDLDQAEALAREGVSSGATVAQSLASFLAARRFRVRQLLAQDEPSAVVAACREALDLCRDQAQCICRDQNLRELLQVLIHNELRPEVDRLLAAGETDAAMERAIKAQLGLPPFGTPYISEEFARIHVSKGETAAAIDQYAQAISQETQFPEPNWVEVERWRGEMLKIRVR